MNGSGTYPFGGVLRGFREREGLSQQALAKKLGIHRNTLGGWERGDYLPDTHADVLNIAEALRLSEPDENLLLTARYNSRQAGPSSASSSSIWKLPHRRNPLFTGRDDVLVRLHDRLSVNTMAANVQPQAISGLGGIGKTQTAIEYAYRYRNEYAHLFWIRAETHEEWTADFVSMASALNLAEKDNQDQNRIIEDVKNWLSQHTGWLLILDNVEHIEYIEYFLPLSYQGSVLLTTRSYITGTIAHAVALDKMSEEEGCLFLLKRAALLSEETIAQENFQLAREIVRIVDGLPLALDQAGAYIYETQCGLASYLALYQRRHVDLLKRRGHFPPGHQESVSSTLMLSIEKVVQLNPAAVDLLRLCAFLAPDAIPEEIIGAGNLSSGADVESGIKDPMALDEMVEALLRYSLIRRDAKHYTLTIHRLVQVVLIESMTRELQIVWAKRAVQALNHAFPSEIPSEAAYTIWPQCQRCLTHALVCTEWISQFGIEIVDAAQLLDRCGTYLQARAQYTQAEALLQRALTMYEHLLGSDHRETATALSHLAYLHQENGRFALAEPLFVQTLAIQQRVLGIEHTETARSCNNLALLYLQQGKYAEAEPLFLQALSINQQLLASEHPDLAAILGNLALLYCKQKRYSQAESLYQQVLTMNQKLWGQVHPRIALSLNDLAFVYMQLEKYALAKPIYEQALVTWDQTLGSEHPNKAVTLHNLARLYLQQGEYSQAESLFQQALTIREQKLGREHPHTASILYSLARLHIEQKEYTIAETLLVRALAIRQHTLGTLHPDTQACQELYAQLLRREDHHFV